jgi:hypothetical protein
MGSIHEGEKLEAEILVLLFLRKLAKRTWNCIWDVFGVLPVLTILTHESVSKHIVRFLRTVFFKT